MDALKQCPSCEKIYIHLTKKKRIYCSTKCGSKYINTKRRAALKENPEEHNFRYNLTKRKWEKILIKTVAKPTKTIDGLVGIYKRSKRKLSASHSAKGRHKESTRTETKRFW